LSRIGAARRLANALGVAIMSIRGFRIFVVISWLILLASYVLPEYVVPSDLGLARLARYDGFGALLRGNFFFVFPLWLMLFASVGLFFLQNWGRYVYLAGVAYSVVAALLFGYRVSSPLESFLGAIGGLLDGAILTLCFLTSLRAYFHRPATPNPVVISDVPPAGRRPASVPPVT
jgi:hypothetical protein